MRTSPSYRDLDDKIVAEKLIDSFNSMTDQLEYGPLDYVMSMTTSKETITVDTFLKNDPSIKIYANGKFIRLHN